MNREETYLDERTARREVVAAGRELVEKNLTTRTWGNISCRLDGKRFAVTPSGVGYERLTPEQIVTVDRETLQPEGNARPSGETGIHAAVYGLRPDVGFVIHTHQSAATVLSVAGYHTLRPTEAEKTLLGCGEIPRAAYGPPCSRRLCRLVTETLKASGANVLLMARHGALVLGKDRAEAFLRAETLERICERSQKKQPPKEKLPFRPEAMITALRTAYPAMSYVGFTDADSIVQASESGRTLLPLLDDCAQLVGVDVRCISPVDPTRAPAALAGRSAVLIQGCGALVAALNAEEGEAVLALLKKECLAEINARLYGGAAPLPLLDRIYMRNVYLNRYSKLK